MNSNEMIDIDLPSLQSIRLGLDALLRIKYWIMILDDVKQ